MQNQKPGIAHKINLRIVLLLSKRKNNLFVETGASGPPTIGIPGLQNRGLIQQGFLELSNVNVVEEMVNLITAQRAYEMNSRTVQTADEILQITNNLKR